MVLADLKRELGGSGFKKCLLGSLSKPASGVPGLIVESESLSGAGRPG